MPNGGPAALRNVAVVSYTGAGKTTLVEAILFGAGIIPTMGSVPAGTATTDFDPEELHRKVSLSTGVAHFDWKGTTVNLLDTPGALSFLGEARFALTAVDGVVVVLSASSGMRIELEKIWATIQERQLPCLIFVNDLDKEQVAWQAVVEECEKALEVKCLPLTIPLGAGAQLEGVVDVVRSASLRSAKDSPKVFPGDVPAETKAAVEEARKRVMEGVAESQDHLLEKYLADGELAGEDMVNGLRTAVQNRTCVPVLCGAALKHIGTAALLEAMIELLPSPQDRAAQAPVVGRHADTGDAFALQMSETAPLCAFVFKTVIDPFMGRMTYVRVHAGRLEADAPVFNASRRVREKGGHLFTILGKKFVQVPVLSAGMIGAVGKLKDTQTGETLSDEHAPVILPSLTLPKPVMSFALEPKSKADVEKVSLGLHKLVEEDPTLEFVRNPETKEMILSGMGQLHVDVTFEKLRRKYGAEVIVHVPKVPYKETIRKMAQAQGKYKKQTGGHGQYGDCWLQLDPLPRGRGFEFQNKIVGGAIPRNFIPAVEKGVLEAMHEGVLAGAPVVDIRVTVYDGSYHVVDSSEMSFKIAASLGFKKALEMANPVLLEPIMAVEVTTPDDTVGGVIGDLNARRGRVLGVTARGHAQQIRAAVPLAEMLTYTPTLNSITGGRATYSMEFASYEEVPRELAPRVIEEQKTAKQQAVASH
jgi:elongation factor G